jgi:hypothetical protein
MLFQDNFDDGDADGWTVVQDSARAPDWRVISGGYHQLNDAGGFSRSFHRGSYVYYTSGLGFSNYRLTVDITPASEGTIGVMFRYQNNHNYYRFAINRNQGFSQLIRRVNGTCWTLAFTGRGALMDQTHTIGVVVNGRNIFIYLDGEPLFSASDSSLSKGTVALFSAGEGRFDNVVVDIITRVPRLIIFSPVSYFVETTSTLDVAAVASQVLSGGSVRFTLDDHSVPSPTSPSLIQENLRTSRREITPLPQSSLMALISPLQKLLPGIRTSLWARGAIILSPWEDSITDGYGDDLTGDNDSSDGRNLSQDYAPILNDLLSNKLNVPITVIKKALAEPNRAGIPPMVSRESIPQRSVIRNLDIGSSCSEPVILTVCCRSRAEEDYNPEMQDMPVATRQLAKDHH